jgi:ArsR family transcriptional regulator
VDGVFGALSHPSRRMILALLREQAMPAGALSERLGMAKPTLSGHLNVLRAAGLIHGERRGTTIIYDLNLSVLEECLASFMTMLRIGAGPEGNDADERERQNREDGS